MGVNEDIGRAADEIIDRVTDAVKNGNYEHLSYDIGQSVKKNQRIISEKMRAARQPGAAEPLQGRSRQNAAGYNPYAAGASRPNSMQQVKDEKAHRTPFMRKADQNGGIAATATLFAVFAAINTVIALVCIILAVASGWIPYLGGGLRVLFIAAACVFGVLDVIFIHFFRRTKKDQDINGYFIKYQKIIGSEEYVSINELCIKTGQPYGSVMSEIRAMMKSGMLPGASFDQKETTLILSDNAREQYRSLMHSVAQKQAEESELPEEAVEILKKGEEYIAGIHRANDLIPEENMSCRLNDLEAIMKKIFAEVRRSPEKRGDLRKLMDYYLPTTLKLVNAYVDLEKQPETDNITATKKEIENSLDEINQACNRIFDMMFEDENWDITSDINVMKSMMKQDGLIDD